MSWSHNSLCSDLTRKGEETMVRQSSVLFALAAVLGFMVETADARVGGGGSSGSRGSRTYSAPPPTTTAPKPAAPIERSMTQPGSKTVAPSPAGAPMASRFGTGFGGLLLGGLLGAGLFGLLSGAGLFGGLTGFASFLGLALQVALIAGIAYLVIGFMRTRNQPALARAGAGASGSEASREGAYGGYMNGSGGRAQSPSTLLISSADYDAFEKLLGDIQTAFSREDAVALGEMTTPEMLSYLSRDLAENKKRNLRSELSEVKLLQGDLSESWTEEGSDYATVAMRFSMIDALIDRATGEVVSGDRNAPQEVTEVWTFRRDHRDAARGWQLSAIQQV
jgi:predicted lipid-binding transport protein (Tim44 family)